MNKVWVGIWMLGATILLSGCAGRCGGGMVCDLIGESDEIRERRSAEFSTKYGLKKEDLHIYVSDELDRVKEDLFVDTMVEAINSHGPYKDIIVSPDNLLIVDTKMLEEERKFAQTPSAQDSFRPYFGYGVRLNASGSLGRGYQAAVGPNWPYEYYMHNGGIIFKDAPYPPMAYSATKLSKDRIEIKGFSNKKEALDFYFYLLKSSSYYGPTNATYFKKTVQKTFEEKSFQFVNPISYFHDSPFGYDPIALEDEGRLILIPQIRLYEIKPALEKKLRAQGYHVVDDEKLANMVIYTLNLAYSNAEGLKHTDIGTKRYKGLLDQTTLGALNGGEKNYHSMGSALHNLGSGSSNSYSRGIAGAELALGVAGALLGASGHDIYVMIHTLYFKLPNGETTAKTYSQKLPIGNLFNGALKTYATNSVNEDIANNVIFDLDPKEVERINESQAFYEANRAKYMHFYPKVFYRKK